MVQRILMIKSCTFYSLFSLNFPTAVPKGNEKKKKKIGKHWRDLWTALRLPAVRSAPWRAPSNKIKK